MKKVACYCRVSTNDQNVNSQLNAIKTYCQSQGWELAKIYKDEGISGAKDKRPALDELKSAIGRQRRGFSAVVVYKFDRMARSTSHLLECLEMFRRNQVDFISISEQVDSNSSAGKLLFVLLAGIAEFERNLIAERVQTGLKRVRMEGKILGRPRVGFDVGEAMKLRNEGWSLRSIGERLQVSYSTINRTLNSVSKTQDLVDA